MKVKIKICGVLDHNIMSTISYLNVDYVGLVFFEKSPRNISIDKAKSIVKYLKYKPVDWTIWKENEERLLKLI